MLIEKNLILSNYLTKSFKENQLDVIGICTDGNQVIDFLKAFPVNIVLMDFQQINGLVITDQIKKDFPEIKVIGFSTPEKGSSINRMMELGASSYLSKYNTKLDELITEIKKYGEKSYL